MTGGEPGGGIPSVRLALEKGFGARVVEVMGIGDISPSLFGETDEQAGMAFCGQALVWPELVEPTTGRSLPIEPGVEGELVLTTVERDAMPLLRFRTRDHVVVTGCGDAHGRSTFRIRCIGRTDDMAIVRGVNLYPSAVQSVVAELRPEVSGRCQLVLPLGAVSVEPPVPVLVELGGSDPRPGLAAGIEERLRARLSVRTRVELLAPGALGPSGYKHQLVIRTASPTLRPQGTAP